MLSALYSICTTFQRAQVLDQSPKEVGYGMLEVAGMTLWSACEVGFQSQLLPLFQSMKQLSWLSYGWAV